MTARYACHIYWAVMQLKFPRSHLQIFQQQQYNKLRVRFFHGFQKVSWMPFLLQLLIIRRRRLTLLTTSLKSVTWMIVTMDMGNLLPRHMHYILSVFHQSQGRSEKQKRFLGDQSINAKCQIIKFRHESKENRARRTSIYCA